MKATSHENGNKIEWIDGKWLYEDGTLANGTRKCIKCGGKPTKDGYDFCLKQLSGVEHACCGHGVEKGYIVFKSGQVIRGFFDIEGVNLSINYEDKKR